MHYAQIQNGVVIQFARTGQPVEFSSTILQTPESLTEEEKLAVGLVVLQQTTPPPYNPDIEQRVHINPLFIDGEWVQQWDVVSIVPTDPVELSAFMVALQQKMDIRAIQKAREHATDIAMRVSVDQVIDSLPDSEVETLTFLYPAWSGDSLPMTVNQKVRYNGILYRVLQGHTTQADWTPDTVPALFTRFRDPVAEPQPWVQPQGAHDAYQIDEQVTHNGQTWTSTVADNVWEPGVFGWVVA